MKKLSQRKYIKIFNIYWDFEVYIRRFLWSSWEAMTSYPPRSKKPPKLKLNLLTGPLFQSESEIWNEFICWQGPPFLSVYESWQGVHLNFEINYLPFALCAHYPLLSVFELLLFVDRNPCFLLIRSAVWNSYLIRIEIRISYPLFWIS